MNEGSPGVGRFPVVPIGIPVFILLQSLSGGVFREAWRRRLAYRASAYIVRRAICDMYWKISRKAEPD